VASLIHRLAPRSSRQVGAIAESGFTGRTASSLATCDVSWRDASKSLTGCQGEKAIGNRPEARVGDREGAVTREEWLRDDMGKDEDRTIGMQRGSTESGQRSYEIMNFGAIIFSRCVALRLRLSHHSIPRILLVLYRQVAGALWMSLLDFNRKPRGLVLADPFCCLFPHEARRSPML
jgi:hypothetical protein